MTTGRAPTNQAKSSFLLGTSCAADDHRVVGGVGASGAVGARVAPSRRREPHPGPYVGCIRAACWSCRNDGHDEAVAGGDRRTGDGWRMLRRHGPASHSIQR